MERPSHLPASAELTTWPTPRARPGAPAQNCQVPTPPLKIARCRPGRATDQAPLKTLKTLKTLRRRLLRL